MQPVNSNSQALLKTILYSHLFHFPLTQEELWRYLITNTHIEKKEFMLFLKKRHPYIEKKGSYYFLKGEKDSVDRREKEKKHYENNLHIARKGAKILSLIPTVMFIGVSGSLAAGSASSDADIDFFIITSPQTVWVSRLVCVMLLSLTSLRRKRGEKVSPGKICLNSFLSISVMDYFSQSKDIYTAHEIAQLYPLLNRENTYRDFLERNKWYKDLLQNAGARNTPMITSSSSPLIRQLGKGVDPICRLLQEMYMKRHRTKEIITKELILLHPHNYKEKILKKFNDILMEYDSLTRS